MGRGYQIFPRSQAFRDNWDITFKKAWRCPECGAREGDYHKPLCKTLLSNGVCDVCKERKEVYAVTESCIYAWKFICNDCCRRECVWYDHEEGCKRLGRWE